MVAIKIWLSCWGSCLLLRARLASLNTCGRSSLPRVPTARWLPRQVMYYVRDSGAVRGAFGFVDMYSERKALLENWLSDPSDNVQTFAREQISMLDRFIAAERRSAEASTAMRKLEHGEELEGGKANHG